MSTERPAFKVREILALLKQGYTRYAKDDMGYGSIQAHYGLTGVEVKELFQYEKLKARKTIVPKPKMVIIDDEEETIEPAPAEPIVPLEDDVVGLEQAKIVVEELSRLEKEGTKSGVPDEDVKETVSKDELFS
jgi:hypothetical protein